ncbi:MAG: hypothetical protein DBX44_03705 [Oscillospiraceae bacterium]|nr:MAG: hypothetical protein DBX44_03705 [Oscillospiraceae bacterium]
MNGKRAYFLVLAEELNFTRAAERLFITQQALSDSIRRMEESYGVLLFERRPKLRLTPSGEAVLRRFRQLDRIEAALRSELDEIAGGSSGQLRLGMSIPRARILAPQLLRTFCQLFPQVELTVRHEETSNFERMLRSGDLDLFLGTNVQPDPEFEILCLMEEPTLVLVSRELLSRSFSDPDLLEHWKQEGADLALWAGRLPFLLNPPPSRLRRQIDEHLSQYGVKIKPFLTISDNETQIVIAAQNVGACFAPQMMAHHALQINASQPDNPLMAFRIAHLYQAGRLDLVYPKEAFLPRYTRALIGLMRQEVERYRTIAL